MERFAHFFSAEMFVRAAFETLNSEVKPEHVGFRAACRTLYAAYAHEHGITEDSLEEHIYDEYMMHIDTPRARRFAVSRAFNLV